MGSLRDKIKFDGAETFETTKGTWNYLFGGYQYFLFDYNDRNQEFILCCINSCGASVKVLLSGTVVSLASHRSNCQKPNDGEIQRRRFQTQAKELVRSTNWNSNNILWHVQQRIGSLYDLSNNEALRLISGWIKQFRENNHFGVDFGAQQQQTNFSGQNSTNFLGQGPSMSSWAQPFLNHPVGQPPNPHWSQPFSNNPMNQAPSNFGMQPPIQPPSNFVMQPPIQAPSNFGMQPPIQPPSNFGMQPLIQPPSNFGMQLPELRNQSWRDLLNPKPQFPTQLPNFEKQFPIQSPELENQPPARTSQFEIQLQFESPKLKRRSRFEPLSQEAQFPVGSPRLKEKFPINPPRLEEEFSIETPRLKVQFPNQAPRLKMELPTNPPNLEMEFPINPPSLEMQTSIESPNFEPHQKNFTTQPTNNPFDIQNYMQKQISQQVTQQNFYLTDQHCTKLNNLINESQTAMNDPKTKITDFDQCIVNLNIAIRKAKNLPNSSQTSASLFQRLDDLIEKAEKVQQIVRKKITKWNQFSSISYKIHTAHKKLKKRYDELQKWKPNIEEFDDLLKKIKDAKQELNNLKISITDLLCEVSSLKPINVIEKDVLQLQTDQDELKQQFEKLYIKISSKMDKQWCLQKENEELILKLQNINETVDKMSNEELKQLEKQTISDLQKQLDKLLEKEKEVSIPYKFIDKSAQQQIDSLKTKFNARLAIELIKSQWLEYKKPLDHQLLEISNQATNLINIYDDESIRNCQLKDFLEKLDKFGSNVHKVNHQLDLASKKLFDFELPDDIKSQFIEELDRDKETLDSNVEKIMDLKKRMEVNNPLIQQFLAHQFNLLSETFNNMCNEINNAQQIENLQQRFRKIYTLKLQAYLLLNDINDFYKSNETQLNSNYSTIDLYGFKLKVKELENFIGFALENTSNQMELNESLVNNQIESNECLSNNQVESNKSIMDESIVNEPIVNEPTVNEPTINEPIIIDLIDNAPIMDEPIIIDQTQNSTNLLDKLETEKFKEHYKSLDLEERKALDIEIFNQKRIKREQDKKTKKLSDLRINNGGIQIEECSRCGKLKHKYLKELCRSCYCKVNKKK